MQNNCMNNQDQNHFDLGVYLLLMFGVSTLILISDFGNNQSLLRLRVWPASKYTSNLFAPKDDLEEALAAASTANKTVIITIVNKAYVEAGKKPMLDLFLDGFRLGEDTGNLTNHLLIVAMDRSSYDRCRFLGLHCYKLETEGVDFVGEKLYMSDDFIKMMWRRTLFLGDVLKRGYNFVFTDTDVLWLRNPFQHLSQNQTLDLQISTDKFNGYQWSESNPINTGLYMILSNNKTVALFDTWYAMKDKSPGQKEQDVLQNLIHKGILTKLGLKVRYLDTVHFSGFCQDNHNAAKVVTMHANCCRRISAKLTDLMRVVRDFGRYKRFSEDKKWMFRWSNHTACGESWKY